MTPSIPSPGRMNHATKGIRRIALAAGLAIAAGLAMSPTAGAMPAAKLPAAAAPTTAGDVVKVGGRGHVSVGIRWHGGHVYYNGYRGYQYKRHGYRHYRGHWFPHRAFVIVVPRQRYIPVRPYQPPRRVAPRIIRLSHAHVRWCDAKYRSYRVSDNTFQPYHGPRKPCVSPYY